jgi:chaperonin GroES
MVPQLIPLGNKIVVLPLKEGDTTKSGLIIPSRGKGDAFHGRVVAVGRGYKGRDGKLITMKYKVGDIVLYGRATGQKRFFNNEEHIIFSDDNILAIYKGKDALLQAQAS